MLNIFTFLVMFIIFASIVYLLGARRTGNWNHPESPPGFFQRLLLWTRSFQLTVERAEIPAGKDVRGLPICLSWQVLFFPNLFGQGIEPFEVEGNAHQIPFPLYCIQSA